MTTNTEPDCKYSAILKDVYSATEKNRQDSCGCNVRGCKDHTMHANQQIFIIEKADKLVLSIGEHACIGCITIFKTSLTEWKSFEMHF